MRPVESKGCNKNGAPTRKDMPMHDQTGGNYWFANMTQYQDNAGTLRLGGGLSGNQILAMDLGQQRAVKHLQQAGDPAVNGNTLKVVNLTGHKLITGYPEGRRMWLNIKWYEQQCPGSRRWRLWSNRCKIPESGRRPGCRSRIDPRPG